MRHIKAAVVVSRKVILPLVFLPLISLFRDDQSDHTCRNNKDPFAQQTEAHKANTLLRADYLFNIFSVIILTRHLDILF